MKIINWWVRDLEIEKPSDVLMYAGFSVILLTVAGLWVGVLVQMFGTNPALSIAMSVISVGFVFLFSGLFLYQKGC